MGEYMKKLFVLMFSILAFIITLNVKAEQLVMNYSGNPYYVISGNGNYHSSIVTYFEIDGDVAYCVEPGILITDFAYHEEDVSTLPYSSSIIKLIKLIGYYGYEYPGHQTDNYRMATQALIWETIKAQSVSFYTEKNGNGDYIDVSREKDEILNMVYNHNTLPSFNNNLTLSIGKDNTLYDSNNALSSFEIINNNSNLEVYKEDNILHIKSNDVGEYQITLRKIKYDNKSTKLFIADNGVSQKLMTLRVDDTIIETTLNIKIVGGTLDLQKLDMDTNSNVSVGSNSLSNARYGIYNDQKKLVEELTTDEFGRATSSYLMFGNYFVKEIAPSNGYEIDSNKYQFTINEDNLTKNLVVYEKLKKKDFTIVKTLEGESNFIDAENNITFEIYFNDTNRLYDIITTNQNGVAKIQLPYGEYLIHQVNTNEGYLKSDDFVIVVDDNIQEIQKVILDKRVRGKIEIIKSDVDTEERLPDAFIEVYKDNELIYSGYTNEDGYIELNDLYVGSYKIIEKVAPDGYLLSEEEYAVDITNDTSDVVVEIKNKKKEEEVIVEVEDIVDTQEFTDVKDTSEEVVVPNTGLNENKILKYSSLGILCLGWILILFRKNTKIFHN